MSAQARTADGAPSFSAVTTGWTGGRAGLLVARGGDLTAEPLAYNRLPWRAPGRRVSSIALAWGCFRYVSQPSKVDNRSIPGYSASHLSFMESRDDETTGRQRQRCLRPALVDLTSSLVFSVMVVRLMLG